MVVVPRETPVTRSHLEHLHRPARRRCGGAAGQPRLLRAPVRRRRAEQLVDFVAGKVLDALGVPHTLFTPLDRRLVTLSAAVGCGP